MDQLSQLKANFKDEILTCFPKAQQEGSGIPLGTILHNIKQIKADIKQEYPQYEISENDRRNKNDKFNWKKFFEEQLPEFTVTRGIWTNGKETDILHYNETIETMEEQTMTTQPVEQKEQIAPVDKTNLPNRIKTLLKYLNQNLYGKEEAVRLALLSAVAGESIFFIGLPGTAKSMISRRIAAAFRDFYKDGKFNTENGGYFEYLMNEFSTPDEICGPVDLSALSGKDGAPSRYTRQTKGYLPSAKVAFLDEIWKSGPAILNTLLTIVNERIFHNGSEIEKVPLISLAAASNELPEKNRGLDALWDRFILRVSVNPVSNEEDFFKIVDDGNKEVVSTAELTAVLLSTADVESWQPEINKIELSNEAKKVITAIRKELVLRNSDKNHEDEKYYISDRRWKKIVHILKTSAFLNGRDSVDLMDCSLIEYCIWNTDKQHDESSKIIEKILKQNGISFNLDIGDIKDQIEEFDDYITKQFYVKDEDKQETLTTMPDSIRAYELYQRIDVNYSYRNVKYISSSGTYYDEKRNRIGVNACRDVSLDVASQKLTWVDSYDGRRHEELAHITIVKGQGLIRNPDFTKYPELLKGRMEDAGNRYKSILKDIKTSLEKLKTFESKQAEPFKQNYFVKQEYCDVILSAVKKSRENLENLQVDLNKKRERYAK